MRHAPWITILFGQRSAIETLASRQSTFWTGLILVLLTSVPRSYDQIPIAESPVRWLLGPLLFSLFSGTWLYLAAYAPFSKAGERTAPRATGQEWRCFMGLFWTTAPVAWLYALPVERWLDSIAATKANLGLLGIVSLWRVLLMARILQVATKSSYWATLVWVVFAASVEALALLFFGGHFAQAIMRGMGGMRNSPEEEILFRAMSFVFGTAFWIAIISFIAGLAVRERRQLHLLPRPEPAPIGWSWLAALAIIWGLIAIQPQQQLARNAIVERHVAAGRYREALDYLSSRQAGDFAPARPLPPKPFETAMFTDLPAFFAKLRPEDPPWVRSHLLKRLDQMMAAYDDGVNRRLRWRPDEDRHSFTNRVETLLQGIRWLNGESSFQQLGADLTRQPDTASWLATNPVFTEALRRIGSSNSNSAPASIRDR